MRLGANDIGIYNSPEEWINILKNLNYSAASCPVDEDASVEELEEYSMAAAENDILIAEVGAWNCNIIHPDKAIREQAIEYVQYKLYLADRIGARCCVSVGGTLSKDNWAGHHMDNFKKETFYMIVESVRQIIDGVKPKNTFYTLEMMPNTFPDSANSYLDMVRAVNREKFAVHFDPVNIISSPRRYSENSSIIKEFVIKLGPWIRSCHAKDVFMTDQASTHIFEVAPGVGKLDYQNYLKQIDRLDPDMPLLIEHLSSQEEYAEAAEYIRNVASEVRVVIK